MITVVVIGRSSPRLTGWSSFFSNVVFVLAAVLIVFTTHVQYVHTIGVSSISKCIAGYAVSRGYIGISETNLLIGGASGRDSKRRYWLRIVQRVYRDNDIFRKKRWFRKINWSLKSRYTVSLNEVLKKIFTKMYTKVKIIIRKYRWCHCVIQTTFCCYLYFWL